MTTMPDNLRQLRDRRYVFACEDGDHTCDVPVTNRFNPPLRTLTDPREAKLFRQLCAIDPDLATFYHFADGCHLFTHSPVEGEPVPRDQAATGTNGLLFYSFVESIERTALSRKRLKEDTSLQDAELPFEIDALWSVGIPCGSWVDLHLVTAGPCKGYYTWWDPFDPPSSVEEMAGDSIAGFFEACANDPIFVLNKVFMAYSRYWMRPTPQSPFEAMVAREARVS